LRKSLNVGPFRFNLSGSGVGVSTGIKGFRIGTGPRGNYIHVGSGGLYFRSTLPSPTKRNIHPSSSQLVPVISSDGLEEIESGSTLQMVDSSSTELLAEINAKSKRMRLWPMAVVLTIVLLALLTVIGAPIWAFCITVPLLCALVYAAALWDSLKKTVVLFYDLEPGFQQVYERVVAAFDFVSHSRGIWHIEAEGAVRGSYERKTHAGATSLVRRRSIQLKHSPPPYFKTNLSIPMIPAGRQTMYFFPDRLLVYSSEGVGAVPYDSLNIGIVQEQFIESDGVPSDARIVDQTWRYVNKSGGPDRRFNDNRELPIALYDAAQFTSPSGLREFFQVSRLGVLAEYKKTLGELADALNMKQQAASSGLITCSCNNCSGHIQFPANGLGQTINCPHCGVDTVLFKPAFA
jgi:hypothetical protein